MDSRTYAASVLSRSTGISSNSSLASPRVGQSQELASDAMMPTTSPESGEGAELEHRDSTLSISGHEQCQNVKIIILTNPHARDQTNCQKSTKIRPCLHTKSSTQGKSAEADRNLDKENSTDDGCRKPAGDTQRTACTQPHASRNAHQTIRRGNRADNTNINALGETYVCELPDTARRCQIPGSSPDGTFRTDG